MRPQAAMGRGLRGVRWLLGEPAGTRLRVAVQSLHPLAGDHAPHGEAPDQGQHDLVPCAVGAGVGPLGVQPAAATDHRGAPGGSCAGASPAAAPPPSTGPQRVRTSRSGRRPRTANQRCSHGPPPTYSLVPLSSWFSGRACCSRSETTIGEVSQGLANLLGEAREGYVESHAISGALTLTLRPAPGGPVRAGPAAHTGSSTQTNRRDAGAPKGAGRSAGATVLTWRA